MFFLDCGYSVLWLLQPGGLESLGGDNYYLVLLLLLFCLPGMDDRLVLIILCRREIPLRSLAGQTPIIGGD